MNDDLENRLQATLHAERLPEAPVGLRAFAAELEGRPHEPSVPRWRRPVMGLVPVGLGIAIVAVLLVRFQSNSVDLPGATISPPKPSEVAKIDGLEVNTVGELLAGRARGEAVGGPYALRGFWSTRPGGMGCVPPDDGQPGDLELWCDRGEWAITEDPEPVYSLVRTGLGRTIATPASGPMLQPMAMSGDDWKRLRSLPTREWPPVPIIVIGHFDDPLADQCRPAARQLCLDRFMIDEIVEFDPDVPVAPVARPTATPFPQSDPPPPPFAEGGFKGDCFPGAERAYEGWIRLTELGITLKPGWDPDTYVYAIRTQNVIPITDRTLPSEGGWRSDLAYPGHQVRWMGQRVCFAEDPWTLYSGSVAGTTYLEIDDGRRIEKPYPFG